MRTLKTVVFLSIFLIGLINVSYGKLSPLDSIWSGSVLTDKSIESFDFLVEVIEHEGKPVHSVTSIRKKDYESLLTFDKSGELMFTSNSVFANVTDGMISMDFMAQNGASVKLVVRAGNSFEFELNSFTIVSSISNHHGLLILFEQIESFVQPGDRLRIVQIDIMSAHESYCSKQHANDLIPVIIYGSAYLDVSSIEIKSLLLENIASKMVGKASNTAKIDDINDDEYPDLLVKFEANNKCLSTSYGYAALRGYLTDGTIINGIDEF
jgi:hypothetical protein